MKKNIFGCLLLFIPLTCCALPTPTTYSFENTQTFNKSFRNVWHDLVTYLADNQIPIKTIERNSGVIYTDNFIVPVENSYMDCDGVAAFAQSDYGSFDVIVDKISSDKTRLTVNSTFGQNRRDIFTNPPTIFPVTCASTGVLENDVFNYIQNN